MSPENIAVFACILFHLLARKPNLEKSSIYSNKFFNNFHLSESSFTCPRLQESGLAQRLHCENLKFEKIWRVWPTENRESRTHLDKFLNLQESRQIATNLLFCKISL